MIMIFAMLPTTAFAAVQRRYVTLRPTTALGGSYGSVKVRAGDTVTSYNGYESYEVRSVKGEEITVWVYLDNNGQFFFPKASDLWNNVSPVDYVYWTGNNAGQKTENGSGMVSNGGVDTNCGLATYYLKSGGSDPQPGDNQVTATVQVVYTDANKSSYTLGESKTAFLTCTSTPSKYHTHGTNCSVKLSGIHPDTLGFTIDSKYTWIAWNKGSTPNLNSTLKPFAKNTTDTTNFNTGNKFFLIYQDTTPAPVEPSAPTAEEFKDLTSLVKVHCTTVDSDHADQTYGLIDGSFTATTPVKRADGSYTSVVTIKNGADGVDKYVAKYNTDVAAGHVEDTGHGLTITVVWTNGTWGYGSDAADPATINVKCTPAPVEPSAPTWDDLETLLAGKVNMVCETNNSHNHTYGLLENTYNTSEVAKNANGVYTCTVTIINDSGVSEYIAKYNDDTNSKHEAGDTANDLTITLEYDKENSKWVVSATDNTAIIYVKCTSEQEAPEAPTAEDLENYKLVKVDCDTRISHGEKSYALLDGTFTTEVTFKDGIFQCVITITKDGAKEYVKQYGKDLGKTHSLKKLEDATITLKYKDNSWVVDDNDSSASILAKCSTGSNTTTGTDDGKTVTSQKTFDAGIALYAGLSILSLTGGALVIRKRKEF